MRQLVSPMLIVAIVFSFPALALGGSAIMLGTSMTLDGVVDMPEVMGELGLPPFTALTLRVAYQDPEWRAGLGLREYILQLHRGPFFGGMVTMQGASGEERDIDIVVELGYRLSVGRVFVEASTRYPALGQEFSLHAAAGMIF